MIGAALIVQEGPRQSLELLLGLAGTPGFGLVPLAGLVIASYLVGFVVGQLWEILLHPRLRNSEQEMSRRCRSRCIEEHNALQRLFGRRTINCDEHEIPRTWVLRDHLRFISNAEVSRLLKLRAERRQCHVLVLGLAPILIWNIGISIQSPALWRLIFSMILVLCLASFWTRQRRLLERYENGTCVAWLMHTSSQLVAPINTISNKPETKERD